MADLFAELKKAIERREKEYAKSVAERRDAALELREAEDEMGDDNTRTTAATKRFAEAQDRLLAAEDALKPAKRPHDSIVIEALLEVLGL